MFSFASVPEPLSPLRTFEFDGEIVELTTRELVETARDREPGSDGDDAAPDLVAKRFAQVGAGIVTEQTFESSFEDSDVTLRNVVLTLPADVEETIVLIAPRDSARPDGAISTGSATAILLELAAYFGSNEHRKQIVLVSTDGSTDGAVGASEWAREAAAPEAIEAVVAIGPAAAAEPGGRPVVRTSTGRDSASMQLVRTAQAAVAEQTSADTSLEGTFEELVRLALPSGLGEQA